MESGSGHDQNADVRTRSEARQREVASRFLASDLAPGGLEAARKFAAKANKNSVPLLASLTKLAGEFREMGVALTPAAAAK